METISIITEEKKFHNYSLPSKTMEECLTVIGNIRKKVF